MLAERNLWKDHDNFDILDLIARKHYAGYYVVVRDSKEPLVLDGITPDIVAGTSPNMEKENIRVVAMVGKETALASGVPEEWERIVDLTEKFGWRVDFFVPRSKIKKVKSWVTRKNADVKVIPI